MFANRLHKILYQSIVMRQCWIPFWIHSSLKAWLLNGGPLSDFSTCGFPCVTKIFSRAVSDSADVTVHYFYLWISGSSSITTNTSSPVGNGPQKSTATRSHDSLGVSVMTIGVLDFWVTVAWQARHPLHLASIFLSIPGNQTLERRSCLLFTMPRCPSWQMLRTWSWSACGITICVPLMTTCSTTDGIFLHMVRGVCFSWSPMACC